MKDFSIQPRNEGKSFEHSVKVHMRVSCERSEQKTLATTPLLESDDAFQNIPSPRYAIFKKIKTYKKKNK